MDAHERVDLAYAGDNEHVTQLVGVPVDGGDERLRGRYSLYLLQQALLAPFLLLGGELLEDPLALGYVQQDVVEVPLMNLRPDLASPELAELRLILQAPEKAPGLELEGRVVAEREDAGLVAEALVGQEVSRERSAAQRLSKSSRCIGVAI